MTTRESRRMACRMCGQRRRRREKMIVCTQGAQEGWCCCYTLCVCIAAGEEACCRTPERQTNSERGPPPSSTTACCRLGKTAKSHRISSKFVVLYWHTVYLSPDENNLHSLGLARAASASTSSGAAAVFKIPCAEGDPPSTRKQLSLSLSFRVQPVPPSSQPCPPVLRQLIAGPRARGGEEREKG